MADQEEQKRLNKEKILKRKEKQAAAKAAAAENSDQLAAAQPKDPAQAESSAANSSGSPSEGAAGSSDSTNVQENAPPPSGAEAEMAGTGATADIAPGTPPQQPAALQQPTAPAQPPSPTSPKSQRLVSKDQAALDSDALAKSTAPAQPPSPTSPKSQRLVSKDQAALDSDALAKSSADMALDMALDSAKGADTFQVMGVEQAEAPFSFTLGGFQHQHCANSTYMQTGELVNGFPLFKAKANNSRVCCLAKDRRWYVQRVSAQGSEVGVVHVGVGEMPWDGKAVWEELDIRDRWKAATEVVATHIENAAQYAQRLDDEMCELSPLIVPATFTLSGFMHQPDLNNTFTQCGAQMLNGWPTFKMNGVDHIWCCRASNGRWNIQKADVKGQNRGSACSAAGEFPWEENTHWKEKDDKGNAHTAPNVKALQKCSTIEHIEVLQKRIDHLETAEESSHAPRAIYLQTLSKNTVLRRKLDEAQLQNAQLTAQLASFLTAPPDAPGCGDYCPSRS